MKQAPSRRTAIGTDNQGQRHGARARRKRQAQRRLAFEVMEQRVLLSTVTWNVDTSGNWDNPANWIDNNGVERVPGPGDDVVISAPSGNPTVTIQAGDDSSVNSLTSADSIDLTGGTLSVATTYQADGTLTQ